MDIIKKNNLLVKHKNGKHFESDLILFRRYCPSSSIHANLERVNSFNRHILDGQMLYELLDKVSMEVILANREGATKEVPAETVVDVEKKLESLREREAGIEKKEAELQAREAAIAAKEAAIAAREAELSANLTMGHDPLLPADLPVITAADPQPPDADPIVIAAADPQSPTPKEAELEEREQELDDREAELEEKEAELEESADELEKQVRELEKKTAELKAAAAAKAAAAKAAARQPETKKKQSTGSSKK